MTTITIDRATVEQALEAMRCAVPTGKITLYEWDKAMAALRAALAQQAEPVAAERERCAEYLMQQAAECRENSPTRVTLESCAAVLRLGLVEWVAQQAEPVEPVARVVEHGATVRLEWVSADAAHNAKVGPLFSMLPQRPPLTDEEIVRIAREAGLGWDEKYHWYVGSESLVRFARLIHTRGQA